MEYKNFELDFVERTMQNLHNTIKVSDKIYEFTDLINQCYGLLIVPEEFAQRKGFLGKMCQKIKYYGFDKKQVLRFNADKFTVANLLRHIRNGLAHSRIKVLNNNGIIVGVQIWDTYSTRHKVPNKEIHTIVTFSADELRTFAIKVAEEYCRLKREKLGM